MSKMTAIRKALRGVLGESGGLMPKGGTQRMAARASEVLDRAWGSKASKVTPNSLDRGMQAERVGRALTKRATRNAEPVSAVKKADRLAASNASKRLPSGVSISAEARAALKSGDTTAAKKLLKRDGFTDADIIDIIG